MVVLRRHDIYVYVYVNVYIYSGILLSHKKNEIVPFAAPWMDLKNIILSEVNQTEKNKYSMKSLIYGI